MTVCDPKTEYACPDAGCIPIQKRCDGQEDCDSYQSYGQSQDERYCRNNYFLFYS